MILWTLTLAVALAQDTDAVPEAAEEAETSSAARAEEIPEGAAEVPLAGGAEAAPAAAEEEEEEPVDYTVIVVREQDVRAARDALVREMESLEWKTRRKRDGRIVFRGPEPWMGKMVLNPNGVVDFTTPAIAFGGTGGVDTRYEDAPRSNMDPQTGSAGMSIGFDGQRKAAAVQTELRAAIEDDLQHLRGTIRARGFGRMVEQLPERLDGVWERGEAMDGGTAETPAARRQDVLDYWASRTDTPEGRVVMRTIEVWLRQVVMPSDHPVTPEEAAAAEAKRSDGRALDLF